MGQREVMRKGKEMGGKKPPMAGWLQREGWTMREGGERKA